MQARSLLLALALGSATRGASGKCKLLVPLVEPTSHMNMVGEVLGFSLGIDVPETPPGPTIGGNITVQLEDYPSCPDWSGIDPDTFFDGLRFSLDMMLFEAVPEIILKVASVSVEVTDILANIQTPLIKHGREGFETMGGLRVLTGMGYALHKYHDMSAPDVTQEVKLTGHLAACQELPGMEVSVDGFAETRSDSLPGKKSHVDYTFNARAQSLTSGRSMEGTVESASPETVEWNTTTVIEVTGYGLIKDGEQLSIMLRNQWGERIECAPMSEPSADGSTSPAGDEAHKKKKGKKKSSKDGGSEAPHAAGDEQTIWCAVPAGIPGAMLDVEMEAGRSCGNLPVQISYSESVCNTGAHAACLRLAHASFDVDTCKCICDRGYTGSRCEMCDVDSKAACGGGREVCLDGYFGFLDRDTNSKFYECTPADLPDAFKAVAVSIECAPTRRTCELHVGGEAMGFSGSPIVCYASNCDFENGAASAQCGNVMCDMGEYKAILKAIIGHDTISGEASFTCAPASDDGIARCILEVSDLPIPISADCAVAECVDQSTLNAVHHAQRMWLATHLVLVGGAYLLVVAIPLLLWLFVRHPKLLADVRVELADEDDGMEKGPVVNGVPGKLNGRRNTVETQVSKLRFDNLSVIASSGRAILSSVSGIANAGELLGIMGPSGSGKTSLLDVLAGVIPEGSEPKGQIYLDDTQLALGDTYPPSLVAYCQQSDLLPSTMSVLECVTFAALLTLPEKMDRHEKLLRATEAIDELGLSHVADSIVGDPTGTGTKARVSGGERRRISLAMSIVAHPSILLLDEVTSGLDSTTAMMMIRTLRALSRRGRIVLLTIHQPSSRAFMGLDRLLLLRSGELVLSTPVHNLSTVCVASGFPCEAGVNMADHLLDVIQDPAQAARITEQSDWHDAETGHDVTSPGGPSFDSRRGAGRDWGATIRRAKLELGVLYWRSGLAVLRHPSLFRLHLIVAIGSALVVGILFHGLGHDVSGLQNRIGAVFFVLALFGFSGLSAMEVFMGEMALSLREMRAGYYGLGTILFTKLSVDALLLRIVPAFAFAAIFYPLVNFDKTLEAFSVFLLITVLVNVAAGTLVAALSIPFDSLGSANLCATILMLVLLLLNGALLNLSSAPAPVAVLQGLSFFRYGFEAMLSNELHNKVVMVEAPGVDPFPLSANLFLSLLGVDPTRVNSDIVVLACFGIFHCFLAAALLKRKIMRNVESTEDDSSSPSNSPDGEGGSSDSKSGFRRRWPSAAFLSIPSIVNTPKSQGAMRLQ